MAGGAFPDLSVSGAVNPWDGPRRTDPALSRRTADPAGRTLVIIQTLHRFMLPTRGWTNRRATRKETLST